MMGRFARGVGLAMLGAVCACNAITGADALDTDPSTDEAPLPSRGHEQGTSTSSSGDLGGSTSSSSGSSTSSTSSGGSSSGANGTDASTTDAGSDAPISGGPLSFLDAFDRADSVTIGNGWTEKTDHFAISGNGVKQSGTGLYKDFLVARPASEAALDVEISVDVTHNQVDGDPCVYARMQPASATLGTLVSYTFYSYYDYVFLDRDDGGDKQFQELASQAISPPLTAPYTYSLSLKVTGTNPVHLVGVVKDGNGNVKATLDVNDGDAKRITTAGSVGFGSGGADGGRFDNFKRTTY